jgi:hypothetical protein
MRFKEKATLGKVICEAIEVSFKRPADGVAFMVTLAAILAITNCAPNQESKAAKAWTKYFADELARVIKKGKRK